MDTTGIIIIDPESHSGETLCKRVTESVGYEPMSAENADDCLENIAEAPPGLIVVRHRPPACNAPDVIRRIRERYPSNRILAVTDTEVGASVVREAFLAGASDVLTEDAFCDALKTGEVPQGAAFPLLTSTVWPEFDNLADILDTMADAVSLQDRELRVLYQNPAHIAMVGEHVGEFCYQAYAEGNEPCKDCPVLGCYKDGLPHRLLKEGSRGLVVDITASPIRDQDGYIWAGLEVVRDVTQKQRFEDALRNTAEGVSAETGESFFHSLTEYLVKTLGVSAAFIGVIDDTDPEISRTISVYHEGRHLKNFWYRKDGTPCGEVASRGLCVFKDALLENFPDIDMLKQLNAQCYVGTPLVSSSGGLLGVLSIIDTKTELDFELAESLLKIFAARAAAELDRLKAENALRESGRRLREMLENVKLAAVMLDTNGGITFVNDFLLEVTGYGRDDVLGRNWFEMFAPSEISADLERYFLAMVGSKDIDAHHENEIITCEGESRLVSWSNTLLRDDRGTVIGVCSIGQDITDKKRTERERSELFHMMTHDIKGPLSIINGYSELLIGGDNSVSTEDSASEIKKASRKIFSLIEDMLTLSAMESGAENTVRTRINLSRLVDQAVDDVKFRADEMSVSIETEFEAGDDAFVYGDKNQLGRSVDNLLINAVNYNRYQGRVTVRTGKADDDGMLFVEVSDTGSGIPEPDLPHIFDKYYRSKVTGKKHGTGLGLAIVKRAVEASGGTVTAWNNADEGATFRVELPSSGGEDN